jgi:hypothetical protein
MATRMSVFDQVQHHCTVKRDGLRADARAMLRPSKPDSETNVTKKQSLDTSNAQYRKTDENAFTSIFNVNKRQN